MAYVTKMYMYPAKAGCVIVSPNRHRTLLQRLLPMGAVYKTNQGCNIPGSWGEAQKGAAVVHLARPLNLTASQISSPSASQAPSTQPSQAFRF